MPRKISKIISHAKNRLSGGGRKLMSTGSGSKDFGSVPGSPTTTTTTTSSSSNKHRSVSGITTDSSRLLGAYDDVYDDGASSGGRGGASDKKTSSSTAATTTTTTRQQQQDEYDDFESPDLNLQSLTNNNNNNNRNKQSTNNNNKTSNQQSTQHLEHSGTSGGSGNIDAKNTVLNATCIIRTLFQNIISFGQRKTGIGSDGDTETGRGTTSTGTGYNELYNDQKDLELNQTQKHWWQSDFLLGTETHGPVLFGTWNGVFVTTVVHLFGVISFLRIGWMVGIEGVPLSMGIVFACLLFNTISLLAAIGIMERCAAANAAAAGSGFQRHHHAYDSGDDIGGATGATDYTHSVATARANVHILIATVLGSKFGGAISLVYCLGQAVSCALHVTGFSETFVHLCAILIERQLTTEPMSDEGHITSTTSVNKTIIGTPIISRPIHPPSIIHKEHDSNFAKTMAKLMHIEIIQSTASASASATETPIQIILTPETFQLVSGCLILLLFIFNIIGIRWLFRLQTLLFLALVAAVGDFSTGLLQTHSDFGYGEIRSSKEHFMENFYPNSIQDPRQWAFWHQLFEVVGVFFPATIGVMAGVNMGSDLERPTRSIPAGSLMAIMASYGVHVLFILGLALTCTRMALLNDYAIAQHVSAWGLFFSIGLYMSTISSALGSMYTAPRIMQNLAQELHSVPVVRWFANGRGPNKIPINALILFTMVTMCFIMVGGINVLAPIVTIPYLMTYAAIEYAYFSMAMTFDIQIQREKRFMQIATQLKPSDSAQQDLCQASSPSTKMMIDNNNEMGVLERTGSIKTPTSNQSIKQQIADDIVSLSLSIGGGVTGNGNGSVSPSPSLQQQHLAGYGSIQSITQHIKIKRRQSTQSSDSDGVPEIASTPTTTNTNTTATNEQMPKSSKSKKTPISSSSVSVKKRQTKLTNNKTNKTSQQLKPKTIKQLMAAVSCSDDEDEDDDEQEQEPEVTEKQEQEEYEEEYEDDVIIAASAEDDEINQRAERSIINTMENIDEDYDQEHDQYQQLEQTERLLMPDPELAEIQCKQEVWYLRIMNRWIVLVAAILKLVLMFVIAWHYALMAIALFLVLGIIIGRTNPGYYPGVSEFSLFNWIRNCYNRIKFWRCQHGYPSVLLSNPNYQSQQQLVASYSYDRIILPDSGINATGITSGPDFHCESDQLTKHGTDYSDRPPCHFTTTINPQLN